MTTAFRLLTSSLVNADEMIGENGVGNGCLVLRHVTGDAARLRFDRAGGPGLERVAGADLGRGGAGRLVAAMALKAFRLVVFARGFGVAMGVVARDAVELAAALAIAS